jgi:hypothetical protein
MLGLRRCAIDFGARHAQDRFWHHDGATTSWPYFPTRSQPSGWMAAARW